MLRSALADVYQTAIVKLSSFGRLRATSTNPLDGTQSGHSKMANAIGPNLYGVRAWRMGIARLQLGLSTRSPVQTETATPAATDDRIRPCPIRPTVE